MRVFVCDARYDTIVVKFKLEKPNVMVVDLRLFVDVSLCKYLISVAVILNCSKFDLITHVVSES